MECGTRKLDQIEADPALLKYLCPKLSIQPLLENAIYHGMEGMYEDGEITIRIYDRDGDIGIDVADNGPGMTQETIDHIMHNKVISSKRGSGIGVRNVNERIQLIYGEDYGVTITSELDEGTTATITIPKMEENDDARKKKTYIADPFTSFDRICIHADDGWPELHRGKDEDYGDLTERQSE